MMNDEAWESAAQAHYEEEDSATIDQVSLYSIITKDEYLLFVARMSLH